MKFLSTWLRNLCLWFLSYAMSTLLNEVPEHMAQELPVAEEPVELVDSSMKFLSTWLRNRVAVTIDPYDYIPQ